ncbi:carboxylesterase family protein [Actimicrobium sp. CCI2.3]|uniref:carboxylesterase family protein n=1 Tax=Actimicrobium sp. CCI2.3 TaxID=3048616 RepID=UPI002AB437A5|nr:carboxylesterase family protein [Actimicrobium sp. CCI2.3]MDY7574702.1 carboxylesterase family protein [Actimicrobium sp. CCI2.3]MEB0020337.1 carboxylesterase family protein [Actimicrobium sp. CCI2.3]
MNIQFDNESQSELARTGQFASIHKSLNIGLLVLIASLFLSPGTADAQSTLGNSGSWGRSASLDQQNPADLENPADIKNPAYFLFHPVVDFGSGDKRYIATGSILDSSNVSHFIAIPYGATTEGANRWRAPQPWTNPEPGMYKLGGRSNPGKPESVNFDPAGLGSRKVPKCMPGEPAAEGSYVIPIPELPLMVPGALVNFPLATVNSENCLYLNVYTKYANKKDSKKPVFVYIPGGGNMQGSAMTSIYDPAPNKVPANATSFLQKVDAVVVTLNYRVGPFGFLAHPELTKEAGTSGTYGNLDQLLALKWVQNNIDQFGGDPDNVTLFGESAGALNTSILNVSPLAAGLFKRTIQQSGYNLPLMWASSLTGVLSDKGSTINNTHVQITPFDANGRPKWPTLADMEMFGTGLVDVLTFPCPTGVMSGQDGYDGVSTHIPWGACGYPKPMVIATLRNLPAAIISAAYSNPVTPKGSTPQGLGQFVPVPPIDGKLLIAQPMEVLMSPTLYRRVHVGPSIIGTNRDEYNYLQSYYASSIFKCAVKNVFNNCSENAAGVNLLSADGSGFKSILQGIFGQVNGADAFNTLPDQYKPKHNGAVDYRYAPDVRDAAMSLLTDAVFTCYSRSLARYNAQASGKSQKSFRYQMNYQPNVEVTSTPAGYAFATKSGYRTVQEMGAMHTLELAYVFGTPYLEQLFVTNSKAGDDEIKKLVNTFQTAWEQYGLTGHLPINADSSFTWNAYPYPDPAKLTDPVFSIDGKSTRSGYGTLSSESGGQFGSGQNYKSQCDWIDQYAFPWLSAPPATP